MTSLPPKGVSNPPAPATKNGRIFLMLMLLAFPIGKFVYYIYDVSTAVTAPDSDANVSKRLLSLAGKKVTIKATLPACPSKATVSKLEGLLQSGDKEAVSLYWQRSNCEDINQGEIVTFEEYSFFSSMACLRKKGEPDCLWVSAGRLRYL